MAAYQRNERRVTPTIRNVEQLARNIIRARAEAQAKVEELVEKVLETLTHATDDGRSKATYDFRDGEFDWNTRRLAVTQLNQMGLRARCGERVGCYLITVSIPNEVILHWMNNAA